MLSINFFPGANSTDYSDSVSEYSAIWEKEGELIVSTWEKITGLKFEETSLDATVSNQISRSHPLILRFNYKENQKKSVLVHELGHRILSGKVEGMKEVDTVVVHKLLDLVLWKVWKEIYGLEFMEEAINFEQGLTENYKTAWDWALAFPEEERILLFKKVLDSDISIILK